MKKVLLKAYGGTALTEDAVKLGLSWLVRQQRSRGDVELARAVQERRATSKTRKPRPRWRCSRFKAPVTRPIEQQERSVHARRDARLERALAQSAGGRPLLRQSDAGTTSALHAGACARSRSASCMA